MHEFRPPLPVVPGKCLVDDAADAAAALLLLLLLLLLLALLCFGRN